MGSGWADCICWCENELKSMFGCVFQACVCSSLMTQRGVVFMQMPHNHRSFPCSHPYLLVPPSPPSLSSEYHTLESSILRVVHHDGQQDAGDDGASSAVTTVAREILQEAAEHVGAALGEILRGEGGAGNPPGGVMGRWRRTHTNPLTWLA